MNDFGDYIMARRKALRHKRVFIADKLGVSATYMRDLELGNRPAPHSEMLLRLIAILEIEKGTAEHLHVLDLAAETRNDVPLDIKNFLIINQKYLYQLLRKMNYSSCSKEDIDNLLDIELKHTNY